MKLSLTTVPRGCVPARPSHSSVSPLRTERKPEPSARARAHTRTRTRTCSKDVLQATYTATYTATPTATHAATPTHQPARTFCPMRVNSFFSMVTSRVVPCSRMAFPSRPVQQMWFKLLYTGFETCFPPSTKGAGIKKNISQIQFLRHFKTRGAL